MLNPDEIDSPNAIALERRSRLASVAPPPHSISADPYEPKKQKWGRWLLVAALIAAGVWAYFHRPPEPAGPGAGKRGGAGGMPVPVVAGIVLKKDIPIYLDGLGTVQAFNSVLVKSRVDGQIVKILFTEGQDVKTGDVLVEIDPSPFQAALAQAEARKAQDDAQLVNAQADQKRYQDLLARKVISSQQSETQDALVRQFAATGKADDAAIDAAKVQLEYTKITSPIDGRVGIRQVDVGNVIHASDTTGIVVITQLHPISLIFTLPEQNLSAIRKETTKDPMTVVAVDRNNHTTLAEGKLSVIDNMIDSTTGTIKLKATFQNEDLSLWPGQFVNARLLLTTRQGGTVVPASVIQRGPDSTYAFVIKEDTSVEIRPVAVEQIEDGQALIESGLTAGERVVVDGQFKLQPGSHIVEAGKGGKGGKEGEVKQQKAPQ